MKILKFLPIIGIILFIYIIISTGIENLINSFASANYFYIFLMFLFIIPTLLIQTYKWHYILKKQDINFKFLHTIKLQIISIFYEMVTPARLGSLIKIAYVQEKTGNFGKSSSSVIVDRALDFLTVAFLAFIGSIILISGEFNVIYITIAVFIVFLLGFFILMNKRLMTFFARIFYNIFIPKKIKEKAKRSFDDFYSSMPKIKTIFVVFLIGIIFWILIYTQAYFSALAFGVNVPYFKFLTLFPISVIISLVPITISGFGTREAILINLLGSYSASQNIIAFSILWAIIPLIVYSIVALFLIFKKGMDISKLTKNKEESLEESKKIIKMVDEEKKEIMLIHPPTSVSERYARDVGEVGGDLPPLGLAMLAAVIKKENFKVAIIDSVVMNYSYKEISEIIKKRQPKAIGISSITPTYHRSRELAEKIKRDFPDILIIIGGHHVTILPEKIIQDNVFDIGVIGEGEITFVELLKKYRKGGYDKNKLFSKLKNIKGIVFKNRKGKVIITKPRPLIENLDELPFPARELLPMHKYLPLPNQYKRKPVIHMTAIRGCPYNCTFCSNNKIFGRKIRARSPEKVIEEIKYVMKKYNAKEISFWDDTMTVNKQWMYKFCDLLINNRLDITWTGYARVDSVDELLLRKMKKAGCWNLFFGYESGDQQLLNNIKKGITLKQISEVNRLCKKIEIEVRASFMIALPGENPALAEKTIRFAKKLNPDYAQFCITTPYPGTELYDNINKYGKLKEDFSKFNIWEPVFIPYGYRNEEQIKKMERKAMKEFYLNPRYILSRIKKINSLEDIWRYFKGFRFLLGFVKK